MEEYQKRFKERTLKHIDLVNEFAESIGYTFPHHDIDKLGPLFKDYSLSFKYDQGYDTTVGLTDDEMDRYNQATIKHITSNPHHPEYFLNRRDMERVVNEFTRDNPPIGLDCSKMTESAIIEMCCD